LELDKALPGNLNLSNKFPDAEMAFTMKAKFTGNKLDDAKGLIVVNDGYYKNRNGQLDFKGIELKSVPDDSVKTLTFTSDFFDVEVDGKYHLKPDQKEQDKLRSDDITELGIEVVRFTNDEVIGKTDNVLERIKDVISRPTPNP